MADLIVAGARWLEAGGGALLVGPPLVLRLAEAEAREGRWAPALTRTGAAALLAGSLLALVAQTAAMAGSLREGLDPGTLLGVVRETQFGRSVAVRLVAAVTAFVLARRVADRPGRPIVLALGAVALASLTWSGHGDADEGGRGLVHLGGDMLHLLAAGAWLGALAAFALMGWQAWRRPADEAGLERGLRRFAGVGSLLVGLIVLSGLVNGWMLVGPAHWRELPASPWGRLLLTKLAVFTAMLGLAALNRWALTPRLAATRNGATTAPLSGLRMSVGLELLAGALVLAMAATMGGLEPPAAGG